MSKGIVDLLSPYANSILMKVLNVLFFLSFIFFCGSPGIVEAQSGSAYPDLSGTWILNVTETKIEGFKLEAHGTVRAEIKQSEPKISLLVKNISRDGHESVGESVVFFTDNRGETNTVSSGERISKTKWSKNKLSIEILTGDKLKKEKEEWWLSTDKMKFYRKITISTKIEHQLNGKPVGEETLKSELLFVYDRSR